MQLIPLAYCRHWQVAGIGRVHQQQQFPRHCPKRPRADLTRRVGWLTTTRYLLRALLCTRLVV